MRRIKELTLFLLMLSILSAKTFPDLKSLLSFAEANSPLLKEVEINLERENYDLSLAEKQRLFDLKFQSSYQRLSKLMELDFPFLPEKIVFGLKDVYDFSLTFTQPLFTGGRISSNIKLKKAEKLEKALEREVLRNQIFLQTAKLYYTGSILIMEKEVLIQNRKFLFKLLEDAENLYENGQIEYSEILELRQKINQLQRAIRKLDYELKNLKLSIFNLIGLDDLRGDIIFRSETRLENLPSAEKIFRKEIQILEKREEEIRQLMKMQKSKNYPQLALMGKFSYGKPGVDLIKKEWITFWSLAIVADITLWDWGKRALELKKLQTELKRIKNLKRKTTNEIRLQIEKARNEYEKNLNLLRLQEEKIKIIQEKLRISREKFSQGTITPTELMKVRTELEEAELERIKTLAAALLARIEYIWSLGLPLKEVL